MSFVLYNETAFNYEKEIQSEYNAKLSLLEKLNLDPRDRQWQEFEIWKEFEKNRPVDYQDHGMASSTVNLLSNKVKEFQFPNDGLRGEDKNELVRQLKLFVLHLPTKETAIIEQIIATAEFLDDSTAVYAYC